jgi:hypothetical protein
MSTPFPDVPDAAQHDDDPLGLESVDQQIRINELRAQAQDLGMHEGYVDENAPPEIEEAFLKNVLAYEKAGMVTHFERLERGGLKLPPPQELTDAAVTEKLWQVIRALARLDTFITSTNHLGDRELYERLWKDSLREETANLPPGSGWNFTIDLVGSGSDEHNAMYLRYYADEKTREHWRKDFKEEIPPHEDPPYKRDHLLPKPKWPPPSIESL